MVIFDRVSKVFFNDQYGVKDVSFAIEPGEMLLVTGPSGSGKTTLMRLLTKEYEPTSGQVFFDHTPLVEIKPSQVHHLRRKIGVVFQDYRLLPEHNVWENIALPLSIIGKTQPEIEDRVTDLLKLVELEDKAELFPNELSGGESQRVSIARALATAPPIIFADEPTGNLDPVTSRLIIKLFKKINQLGTTVVVATHDVVVLDELKKIRHLKLKKGELVKDTHPKAIKVEVEIDEIDETSDEENRDEAGQDETNHDHQPPIEIEVESVQDDKQVSNDKPATRSASSASPSTVTSRFKRQLAGLLSKKKAPSS